MQDMNLDCCMWVCGACSHRIYFECVVSSEHAQFQTTLKQAINLIEKTVRNLEKKLSLMPIRRKQKYSEKLYNASSRLQSELNIDDDVFYQDVAYLESGNGHKSRSRTSVIHNQMQRYKTRITLQPTAHTSEKFTSPTDRHSLRTTIWRG